MIVLAPSPDAVLAAALTRTLATSRAPSYLRTAAVTPWDRAALAAALVRFLATLSAPKYLRDAATPWLAKAVPPPAA